MKNRTSKSISINYGRPVEVTPIKLIERQIPEKLTVTQLKKMIKEDKIRNLKDELDYCKKLVEAGHKNLHWAIRVAEITKELNTNKKRKKKKS